MAALSSTWTTVNPHFFEPEILMQWNQPSGAFLTLEGGNPRQKIGSEDKAVYMKTLKVSTQVRSNQAAGNQLPSPSLIPSTINASTYLNRTRVNYDHHDVAMASEWGFALPEAYRLANRQAHFQLLRGMLLFGNLPANGEGLVNTPGATAVSLPQDSKGATTARTYDNGEMAVFFLQQLLNTMARAYQLGQATRFVVLGPQRTLGLFELTNIVQLTTYQRSGAGTDTTVGMIKGVAGLSGCTVEWAYDDTLQNYSAAGVDTILIVMPEIQKPRVQNQINTNEFANLTPGQKATTLMYTDMPAPREVPSPLAGGATDVLYEQRATPGWCIRPEALTIVSMTY